MVHGCFWHRHKRCQFAYTPKSRVEFWQAKFKANVSRDEKVKGQLEQLGWRVIVVWACELREPVQLCKRLETLLRKNGCGIEQ
jgi:DNA mismatch endonuclease (patch repair protein)